MTEKSELKRQAKMKKWLDRLADFVNEPNKTKIRHLVSGTRGLGYEFFPYSDQTTHHEDNVDKIHELLETIFENIRRGDGVLLAPHIYYVEFAQERAEVKAHGVRVVLDDFENGYFPGLGYVMGELMIETGIRWIRRCESCKQFMFAYKENKNTCGPKCRVALKRFNDALKKGGE